MHPTLFDLSLFGRNLALDAHGLLLTVGAVVGLVALGILARADGLPQGEVRELGLEVVLIGIVVGRGLLHVWPPAALYGGIAAAFGWLAYRARLRGWGRLRMLDLAAPAFAIGYALARVGCFLSGCCAGGPTSAWVGMRFPSDSAVYQTWFERGWLTLAAETTPPLHPVQLYEAVGHMLIGIALLLLARRVRPGSGRVIGALVATHVILRVGLLPFAGR